MSDDHNRLLGLMPKRPDDYDPWGSNTRWADAEKAYPDCSSGCRFARWLEGDIGSDWCVCTNPASHRCGLLTFEHQGCQQCEHPDDDESENFEYVPSRRIRGVEQRLAAAEKRLAELEARR